jgi:hypothetical protein
MELSCRACMYVCVCVCVCLSVCVCEIRVRNIKHKIEECDESCKQKTRTSLPTLSI